MTLQQWCKVSGENVTVAGNGATSVYIGDIHHQSELLWDLWHLADYAVSSVAGPVAWLVPRTRGDI